MFIIYFCDDCKEEEIDVGVIPMKKCPKCGVLMFANEWDMEE